MVETDKSAATEEKKSAEDDIPSDGGASDISGEDLATPLEPKAAAPAPAAPAAAVEQTAVPDASAEIQTSTESTSSTSTDSGLKDT